MTFSSILFLNPPIHHHKPLPFYSSISSSSSSSHSLTFNSRVCFSSSNPSHSDREEQKWLREEQRWLREEQRWLREEQRWARERESLLRQISALQFRIQGLERQVSVQGGASVSETIASIAGLLQVLKDKSLIAESGSSMRPMVLEGKKSEEEEEEEEKEVVVEKVIRVVDGEGKKLDKRRISLRKGSEGEEVLAMQVCYLAI